MTELLESAVVNRERLLDDILCGVNGSRASYEAVRQAAVLAGPRGRLSLVAITALRGAGSQCTASIAPGRAARALAHARRLAVEAGVEDVAVGIDDGSPVVETLLGRARTHGLLAVGAPLMPRFAHVLVGGTASEAAHLLPTSLLVARRPPAAGRFGERMLVASDGSARSDALVDFAIALAAERDATLMLLHAAHGETRPHPVAIAAQVERLVAALGDRACVRIESGRPRTLIIDAAGADGCSLIVVASRRLSGLRAIGSLSERLVHDARCSVLVMRPEDVTPARDAT